MTMMMTMVVVLVVMMVMVMVMMMMMMVKPHSSLSGLNEATRSIFTPPGWDASPS